MDAHHHTVPSRASRGHLVVSEPELIEWGERLGADSHPRLIIALSGELGAGKTTLAQAICRGYGVTAPVTSPTYAIVQEYASPRSPVYHIDLYRIGKPDELEQLGWSDIVTSNSLVIVEWPEHAGGLLPPDHVPISLDYAPDMPDRRLLLAG
ncbi:MAG: tRNA (adenosine(37)-N6)-threonylcarbamoyltransferase complex ATPase subunit type 1 TsaE [Gemmatimonadota bacterium]|nr:tRNA (adenosine(37)-N6)-threonylcarbamoyltransferase complex ATPase subunit type 1 TsaE [Gemmatimonadota bacterium]